MSAPSFSSFQPSFSSFPDFGASSSSRRAGGDGEGEKGSGANDGESTHRKRRRDKDKRESSSRKRDRQKSKSSRLALADDQELDDLDEHNSSSKPASASERRGPTIDDEDMLGISRERSKTFFSDHKGDSLNVTFGGLHSGNIAKYSLIQHGRVVLGLPGFHIQRREGATIIVESRSDRKGKGPELSDKRTRKLLESSVVRRFKPALKSEAFYAEEDGFIRVSTASQKGALSVHAPTFDPTAGNDDDDPTSDSSSNSDIDAENEDDPDTSPLSAREESLRSLEQALKKDPTSTSAWLSLLEHTVSGINATSKNSQSARSEITVSVLNRAINAHLENLKSPLLRLKLLKSGEDIWEAGKLESEWEAALRITKHPDVWMEWLDWRLRRCPDGFEGGLSDAQRALGSASLGLSNSEADIVKLRIFWRLAVFFKQTGFVERGTALFQAQAELTFKQPVELKHASFAERLDALENFWESEFPRVGEPSAQGWSSWKDEKLITQLPPPPRPEQSPDQGSSYTWWVQNEDDDEIYSRHLPSRADAVDEDPYCTVLFSDIRAFLFPFRVEVTKQLFRLVWIYYVGLRTPGFVEMLSPLCLDEKWAEGSFAGASFISSLLKSEAKSYRATQDSFAGIVVGREKSYRCAFDMIRRWSYDSRDPLDGVTLIGTGRQWDKFNGDESLVRCIFEQLQLEDDEDWLRLRLAFEASVNLKGSTKISKSILSSSSSSPLMWAGHARLERMRGRFEEARKVYQTVLPSLPLGSSGRAIVSWDFAEMEWLLGRTSEASDVIFLSAGQQESQGGVPMLRTKRILEDYSEDTRTREENRRARIRWVWLRALLELLWNGLESALAILDSWLNREQKGAGHESLAVFSLLLLYHHSVTLKSPTPRALLRERVSSMLEQYPSNTIILGIFLECEKGEGIWGRVRTLLGQKGSSPLGSKPLSQMVAEVWISGWEENRWKEEVERVKTHLEAAVVCDETRGSLIVWRILLQLEINYGSLKRAKIMLFRALGDCPMAKGLYLLAFGPLREEFTERELFTLADTMAEKGIRLRKSLDEIVSRESTHMEDGEENDEPGNELEYNSRELRRLLPY